MYKTKLSPGEASAGRGACCGAAICQRSFLPAHTSQLPSLHTELSSLLVVLFLWWFRLSKANARFPEAEMPLALGLAVRKRLQQESSSWLPIPFRSLSACSVLGRLQRHSVVPGAQLFGGDGVILGSGGCLSMGWRAQIPRGDQDCKNSAVLRGEVVNKLRNTLEWRAQW